MVCITLKPPPNSIFVVVANLVMQKAILLSDTKILFLELLIYNEIRFGINNFIKIICLCYGVDIISWFLLFAWLPVSFVISRAQADRRQAIWKMIYLISKKKKIWLPHLFPSLSPSHNVMIFPKHYSRFFLYLLIIC